jgi:transcriptional regulator with XRE-family HTH domain
VTLVEFVTSAANAQWMAKAEARPAKVTPEHKEEARLLKELWTKRATLTQEEFGGRYDIGGQSAVWRFLNAKDPLSLKAAKGFAKGLNCQVSDFSPRLAREIAEYAKVSVPEELDLSRLDREEFQLVQLYRGLDPDQKHELLVAANNLYVQAHPEKGAANPFPDVEPVHSLLHGKRPKKPKKSDVVQQS